MRSTTPSRYRPAGPFVPRARMWARRTLLTAYGWTAIGLVELGLFTTVPGGVLRPLAQAFLRRHAEAVRGEFDSDFYLRQISHPRRRRRAARAPLLHYAILGWREFRTPTPGFDPTLYRQDNPALPESVDPFLHHLRHRQVGDTPKWITGKPAILTINHWRGGGSSFFLDLYERHWRERGYNILRTRAVRGAPELGVIDLAGESEGRASVVDLERPEKLAALIARWRVERIVVNHVVDRPRAFLDWIRRLSAMTARPYDVVLHDYIALCPRINLVTGDGSFCDAPAPPVCVGCVAANGSDVKDDDVRSWRTAMLDFTAHADQVVVPSEDAAARMTRHLDRGYRVWHPESDTGLPDERIPVLGRDETLRVATLGAVNVPKGSQVLAALARQAYGRPISFTVLGPSPDTPLLARAGVRVTGAYQPDELDRLIDEAAPHVVFLPAIWPETWSFVLTTAMRRGLPVIAFDMGAPAERLRRLGRGHLLAPELATRPVQLLAAFTALRAQWIAR